MKRFSIAGIGNSYVELCAPLKVYYDITTKCNLNCVFCFKGKPDIDVSRKQAFDNIAKIADANIPDVVFIGGEPLCCEFFFEAVEYAKSKGLNVGIVTNGTLFTDENVKLLKALVNNSISISLHAPNDSLHDSISNGKNTYTKIFNGLRLLNSNGIIPEIAFTPIKENVPYLFQTIDGILSKGIKVSDVLVNRLIPYGNALIKWNEKKVVLEDQEFLLEQMYKLQEKYPDLVLASGDAIPFCMVEEKYRKFIARCDYAITLGWIDATNHFGKCMVRGCADSEKIDNNTIKDLWKRSKSFICHRHMKSIPEDCKSCEWLIECGGGCACSSSDNTSKDAFFNSSTRYKMPHNPRSNMMDSVTPSEEETQSVLNESVYTIHNRFLIRKEKDTYDINELCYLFIPASSGAVIQDIIKPESGEMLWLNEVEKQIVLYLQTDLTVIEVARSVSYEFGINIDEAVLYVKKTIAGLKETGVLNK